MNNFDALQVQRVTVVSTSGISTTLPAAGFDIQNGFRNVEKDGGYSFAHVLTGIRSFFPLSKVERIDLSKFDEETYSRLSLDYQKLLDQSAARGETTVAGADEKTETGLDKEPKEDGAVLLSEEKTERPVEDKEVAEKPKPSGKAKSAVKKTEKGGK